MQGTITLVRKVAPLQVNLGRVVSLGMPSCPGVFYLQKEKSPLVWPSAYTTALMVWPCPQPPSPLLSFPPVRSADSPKQLVALRLSLSSLFTSHRISYYFCFLPIYSLFRVALISCCVSMWELWCTCLRRRDVCVWSCSGVCALLSWGERYILKLNIDRKEACVLVCVYVHARRRQQHFVPHSLRFYNKQIATIWKTSKVRW